MHFVKHLEGTRQWHYLVEDETLICVGHPEVTIHASPVWRGTLFQNDTASEL